MANPFSPTVAPWSGPDFPTMLSAALSGIRQTRLDRMNEKYRQAILDQQAQSAADAAQHQALTDEMALRRQGLTMQQPPAPPRGPAPDVFTGARLGPGATPPAGALPAFQGAQLPGPAGLPPVGPPQPSFAAASVGAFEPGPRPRPVTSPGGVDLYHVPGYVSPEDQRQRLIDELQGTLGPERSSLAATLADKPQLAGALLRPTPPEGYVVHGKRFADLGGAIAAERQFANAGARTGMTPSEALTAQRQERQQALEAAQGDADTWAAAGVPQAQIAQFVRSSHRLSTGDAGAVAQAAVSKQRAARTAPPAPGSREEITAGVNKRYGIPTNKVEQGVRDLLAAGYTPAQITERLKAFHAPPDQQQAAADYLARGERSGFLLPPDTTH